MRSYVTTPGNAFYVCVCIKALIEANMHFSEVLGEIVKKYKKQFGKSKWFTNDLSVKVVYLEEEKPGVVKFILRKADGSISKMSINFATSDEAFLPVSEDIGIVCLLENEGHLLLKKEGRVWLRLPWINARENSEYQQCSHQYDFSGMRGTIIPGYGVFVPYKMCEMLKAFNVRGKVVDTKIFTFPLCESRGLVQGNIGIPRFWFPVVMKTQGPVNEKLYKEIPLDEAEKWFPSQLEYEIFHACYGA